jgi:hypothetical protein
VVRSESIGGEETMTGECSGGGGENNDDRGCGG